MRPYLVWTLPYKVDSSGEKVLHRLVHELNLAGQEAYTCFDQRNPKWQTPYHPGPLGDDWIAVYPEVVTGNPLNAPHVARWVLNKPGKLGGDKTYDPSEEVFCFAEQFNVLGVPPDRIMYLPAIELDIYTDRHLPRRFTLYYVGRKRGIHRPKRALEISPHLRRRPRRLAHVLNRAALLVCYDNMTAMNLIARLCGCPVMLVPDGEWTLKQFQEFGMEGMGWDEVPGPFDSDVIRAREVAAYDTFKTQLAHFIDITQSQP